MTADKQKASDYLIRLQAKAYQESGAGQDVAWAAALFNELLDRAPEFQDVALNRVLRDMRSEMPELMTNGVEDAMRRMLKKHSREPRRSPYENPLTRMAIQKFQDDIQAAAKVVADCSAQQLDVPDWPIIGFLPTHRLSAMVVAVPNCNDVLIVLDNGMIYFIGEMADLAVRILYPSGDIRRLATEADIRKRLRSDTTLTDHLVRITNRQIRGRDSGEASALSSSLTKGQALVRGFADTAMQLFVLGHEYGHLMDRHLARAQKRMTDMEGFSAEELLYSHWHEFGADYLGAHVALKAIETTMQILACESWWAIDYFMTCLSFVESVQTKIRTGSYSGFPYTTHPPTVKRRETIREVFAKRKGSEQSIQRAKALEIAFDTFLSRAESRW